MGLLSHVTWAYIKVMLLNCLITLNDRCLINVFWLHSPGTVGFFFILHILGSEVRSCIRVVSACFVHHNFTHSTHSLCSCGSFIIKNNVMSLPHKMPFKNMHGSTLASFDNK